MLNILAAVTVEPKLKKALGNPAFSAEEKANALADVCVEVTSRQGKAFFAYSSYGISVYRFFLISQLFLQFKLNFEKAVNVQFTSAFELTAEQTQHSRFTG